MVATTRPNIFSSATQVSGKKMIHLQRSNRENRSKASTPDSATPGTTATGLDLHPGGPRPMGPHPQDPGSFWAERRPLPRSSSSNNNSWTVREESPKRSGTGSREDRERWNALAYFRIIIRCLSVRLELTQVKHCMIGFLSVVWAEFSALSLAVLLLTPKLCSMQMTTSKVGNSA